MEKLCAEFSRAINEQTLKKAVFSKPKDKNEIKTVFTVFLSGNEKRIKKETFLKDGKAIQKILTVSEASDFVCGCAELYRQINLIGENKTL